MSQLTLIEKLTEVARYEEVPEFRAAIQEAIDRLAAQAGGCGAGGVALRNVAWVGRDEAQAAR